MRHNSNAPGGPRQRVPLLMTRPEASGRAFWERLPESARKRLDLVLSPLMEIRRVGRLPEPDGFDGLVFTSANGVHSLDARTLREWSDKPAFAVGQATARAATDAGFATVSADGDADDLVDLLARAAVGNKLLHVRGRHARGEVAERACALGVPMKEAIVYDQVALPLSNAARKVLGGNLPVILPLFSPRTAASYAAGSPACGRLYIVAMSKAVMDACAGIEARARLVATRPDAEGMTKAIEQALDQALLEGM